jgi:hypothetical protein
MQDWKSMRSEQLQIRLHGMISFLDGAGYGLGSFRRRSRWILTDNQASFPH